MRTSADDLCADEWRQRYAEALIQAEAQASAARRDNRHVACGFTSNVDRLAQLDAELVARLFAGRAIDLKGPRIACVDSVDDLLTGIARCVVAGDGTDLRIREPAVQAWLLERIGGRNQVGGTGAQAASTLATLGFPAILHLTGRSPEQIAVLAHRERIVLGTPDGLLPVEQAANPDDPTMWHPTLEYAEGLQLPLPGALAARTANRILSGHDPVNAAFRIDPGFAAALADPALEIDALLVSGFSQCHDDETRARILAEAARDIARWREARPGLFVHLELGAMPDFAAVAEIVAVLHPVVTSIGMNIDELRELLAVHGVTLAAPGPEMAAQMRGLRERYPVPRLSMHTREFCLTLTEGDPEQERDALLFGSLAAASRSRIATFPVMADLVETLAVGQVNQVGLALARSLPAEPGLVATPGIGFAGPVATVGLGDSFTGGVLALA